MSFLPLLRPFIIKLPKRSACILCLRSERDVPVDETLDDGHLRLLELLLGITASGVGKVDSVTDLDVVGQGDVLDLDTVLYDYNEYMRSIHFLNRHYLNMVTHSWVSHLPKSLTS